MVQNVEKIVQDFCGTWELISGKSNYSLGHPPKSGTYLIELLNGKVHFNVSWVDHEDNKFQVQFDGIPDGKKHPYEGTPSIDSIMYQVETDRTFRSVAYNGNTIVNDASRTLSEDKTLLFVTQRILGQDGSVYDNSSVYKRVSSDNEWENTNG
jgi:hypothetical protein